MDQKIIVPLLAIVALSLLVFVFVWGASTPSLDTSTATTTVTSSPGSISTTTDVQIALLDTSGNGTGKKVGCDTVTLVKRTVPKTTAVLTAAMQALFAEPAGEQPGSAYNFIARTTSTLQFDRATITDGTANIYLTGSLSGLAGVCDDPRAASQIQTTAMQFPTVQKVQIYLDEKPTTLIPNEQ